MMMGGQNVWSWKNFKISILRINSNFNLLFISVLWFNIDPDELSGSDFHFVTFFNIFDEKSCIFLKNANLLKKCKILLKMLQNQIYFQRSDLNYTKSNLHQTVANYIYNQFSSNKFLINLNIIAFGYTQCEYTPQILIFS